MEIGAYVTGSNPEADRARALMPRIDGFLRQDLNESSTAAQGWAALSTLLRDGAA